MVSEIVVLGEHPQKVVVTLGDSITAAGWTSLRESRD